MISVYWIHHKDHSDIFSQGYVGVTKRYERRMWEHKNLTQNYHFKKAIEKYGWDNLIKEKIVIGDEDYCLEIEAKLRPEKQIGWNIVNGGGLPPKLYGNKHNIGKTPWNKGKKGIVKSKYKNIPRSQEMKDKLKRLVTCPKCNLTGGIAGMSVHHFDNCKGGNKPYKARVSINGKRIYLGVFKTKEEAKIMENKYLTNPTAIWS